MTSSGLNYSLEGNPLQTALSGSAFVNNLFKVQQTGTSFDSDYTPKAPPSSLSAEPALTVREIAVLVGWGTAFERQTPSKAAAMQSPGSPSQDGFV